MHTFIPEIMAPTREGRREGEALDFALRLHKYSKLTFKDVYK